ncbi:hypothetical protein [Pseudomonas psychrophila]|uniref:Uncharacterized protein n=1 Tax=Pseudomonas psychrophila TaxID=122355 RepID=A0A8I1KAA5_9PSED|nr:hypothetical protein [Pseudomonas psychrophila]AVX93443.1 hypothetical protein PkP19E3_34485 [Pseudomonas koreensis]MBJ2259200.1 hypothetical protein [Pseudomonas psychrophila]
MADDFIRIVYRREVGGKSKRTSVSIDPLLFEIFSQVRGGISEARTVLRVWAMEADADRTEANWRIGNSRLVQQRMSVEILEAVKLGIAYRKLNQSKGGKGKSRGAGPAIVPAGDLESQQLPAVTGHLEVEHG